MGIGERYQTDNWRTEKHVPVIDCPDTVNADEMFEVTVTLGKEVAHPNTTEHHIAWISLYYHPDGSKFTYDLGHFEFNAHGAAVAGPNEGPAYTHHGVSAWVKLSQPGTLHATAYCNIHGLWESTKEIDVE